MTNGKGVFTLWQAFLLTLVGLIILTVLTVTGDIAGEVSVPIIAATIGAATGAGTQKALNGGPRENGQSK